MLIETQLLCDARDHVLSNVLHEKKESTQVNE